MATSWSKITVPLFEHTDEGYFDAILTKNYIDHRDVPEADHVRLTSYEYFNGELDIDKFRDLDNRLVASDISELTFNNPTEYSGVSDGSPVYENLANDKVNLFGNFFSDRTAKYYLWIRRTKRNLDIEYPFSGDFRRKDIKFSDINIYAPSSSNEFTSGTMRLKASPAKRRLEDLLVSDFIKEFVAADTPERGSGDTDHIPQPFYGGVRYRPGWKELVNSHGVTNTTTLNEGLADSRCNTFDYSMNVQRGEDAFFPLGFNGVSFYTLLSKLFAHPDINISFGTSSYDDPAYILGYQTYNDTDDIYEDEWGIDGAGTMPDLSEVYPNFNVLFGVNPRPDKGFFISVDTGTDTISTTGSIRDGSTNPDHGFNAGDQVYFFTQGTLSSPLETWTPYYVINPSGNDFQVSLTEGGSAINLSGGSGTSIVVRDLFLDTPNTLKLDSSVLELVKRVCWQHGYYMKFGVEQSGADEGKTTIYFRERLQSPPTNFPNLTLSKEASDEEPPQKPLVLKVSHEGDEDELYTPKLPDRNDEVLEVVIPWGIHAFSGADGLIYWNHIKYNDKLSQEEQNQCIYERDNQSGYHVHDYSHVLGRHLFRFKVKNSANTTLPEIYDDQAQHNPDEANTNFEGFHVWNICARTPTSRRYETIAEFMLQYLANDLLRGQYGLKRTFDGITDSSDSMLTLEPLNAYSTRRDGATRNYYVDRLKLRLRQRKTEVVFEEEPDSYTELENFPVFRKKGSGQTSGGGRPSTGSTNTGDSDNVDTYVRTDESTNLPHMAVYGNGYQGNLVFDGSATVGLLAPTASVYTMVRDIYAGDVTVDSGVTLITNGFRLFCEGTLTNDGTIHNNGNDAAGVAAGAATNSVGSIGFGAAGGAGATGAGNGTAGTDSNHGVVSNSGNGDGGNCGANIGGAGGSNLTPAGDFGGIYAWAHYMPGISGLLYGTSGIVKVGGGAGGGGGASNLGGVGGGGGSGGGVMLIAAFAIVNNGTISCNGGDGANGTGTNAGGGGSGQGGVIYLVYHTYTGTSPSVNAGTPGNGVGIGTNGTSGEPGFVVHTLN